MTLRIGLVGCGNISDVYLINAALFPGIHFTAVADIRRDAAKAKGAKYGLPAVTPAELLRREDVDLVLNLTVPAAHAEVSLAAIAAGKHVYSEKPLAISLKDGKAIMRAAALGGVKVGAAPDTVLGAGIQTSRRMIDMGEIGNIVTGTATVLSHGMESWHPNPVFFFKPGGGPVLDMGPYYLTALVNLLGPIDSIAAVGKMGFKHRTVTSEGPMKGRRIKVETLTTVSALLSFASGAQIVLLMSWDVWRHGLLPLELHGSIASLRVPDPNFFGGAIEISEAGKDWQKIETGTQTYGRVNWPPSDKRVANYRGLGVAEMAAAIAKRREPRCSGAIALHVLDAMTAILSAAVNGKRVKITSPCRRPPALGEQQAMALIKQAR
jgi:predicted dehydrogenase